MMENIEFRYCFKEDGEAKEIKVCKNADALHDYEVCEILFDFMKSIGFSEDNILRYFHEGE